MNKCTFLKDHLAPLEKQQENFDKHGRDIFKENNWKNTEMHRKTISQKKSSETRGQN